MKISKKLVHNPFLLVACMLAVASSAEVARAGQKFALIPNLFRASPFSAAADVNGVLWISGMIGTDETNRIVPGGMPGERRRAISNIGNLLRARGLGFEDVYKCTVMLADMSRREEFSSIYVSYFRPGHLPARTAIGANGLSRGAQIDRVSRSG